MHCIGPAQVLSITVEPGGLDLCIDQESPLQPERLYGTLARSGHRGAVTVSDRPDDRPVPLPRPRVCTSRANTDNGTNDGTNTERAGRVGTVTEGR